MTPARCAGCAGCAGWWCTGASRDIRPRKLHLHSHDRSSAETSHNGSPQTRSYANDLLSRRFVRSTIATRLRLRSICLSVQSHNLWTDLRSPSFSITLQISQFILILFIIGLAQNALTGDNGLFDLLFLLCKAILERARIDSTPMEY